MVVAMRRPVVAGNWKMHGSRSANEALLADLVERVKPEWQVDVVVFPPYVYLTEVGAPMVKDVGARYAIVGHSERRRLYHEDDALVARKFGAALKVGLTPVLCVGETLEEHEARRAEEVVARQLDAVTAMNGVASLAHAIVAYEPVWAIGTGRNATPEQAQAVHAYVRRRIAAQDAKIAGQLRILYGGSVKASNAAELFGRPDVDGGLVGGASLAADEFLQICAAAAVRS
jgi:triosephosphate isomerase (TIM)